MCRKVGVEFKLLVLTLLTNTIATSTRHSHERGIIIGAPSVIGDCISSLTRVERHVSSARVSSRSSQCTVLFAPLACCHSPTGRFLHLHPSKKKNSSLNIVLSGALVSICLDQPSLIGAARERLRRINTPVITSSGTGGPGHSVVRRITPGIFRPRATPSSVMVFGPGF